MVSGGSGITPFISVIRDLIFQSQQQEFQAPKLLLVCIFKNYVDLTMLDLMLPISGSTTKISNLQLQIEAYITREKEEPFRDTQKHIQTIWFKPNLTDSPISAVLGPNNWLWLSAIITSSFIMFLLLLGILTRYYIYPIESKSGEVYNWTFKVLWYMFLLCACICICSSVVFLWWKRHNTLENKQIMNEKVQTPTISPGSWIYGSEREVESLPHQSLVQATQVHFGARPDLKSKLCGRVLLYILLSWFFSKLVILRTQMQRLISYYILYQWDNDVFNLLILQKFCLSVKAKMLELWFVVQGN
jgi:hypothetical protein